MMKNAHLDIGDVHFYVFDNWIVLSFIRLRLSFNPLV